MMTQMTMEQIDREFTKYIADPEIKADIDAYYYAANEEAEQDALDGYRARHNAMTPEQRADYDHRMYLNIKRLIECTRRDMDEVLTRLENEKQTRRKRRNTAAVA